MITLRDYANNKKISYEAVRKQVNRYREELGEHIIQDGRQQVLDNFAVAFLDEKRMKNPIIMEQADKNDTIENLERENKNLLIKVAEQANRIAELADWKAMNAVAIAEVDQNKKLLEDKQKEVGILEGFLKEANQLIDELKKEKVDAVKAVRDHYAEELKEKDELIEGFRAKAEAEAKKTKWQRIKEIWRTRE